MDRLELLASLAKGSKCLCDVGCDHAYAIIKAIKNYGVERGIAADINEGPLGQARLKLTEAGLLDKVDIALSDGFKAIDKPFDTVIIAGMGGILIKSIIEAALDKLGDKRLILEPNSDAPLLRAFLGSNGFKIIEEHAIIDMGKYYEIMVVVPGEASYSDLEIKYGPILIRERPEAYKRHYEAMIKHLESLIDKIKKEDIRASKLNQISELKKII